MASWSEIERAAPSLAQKVRAAFDAHKHKVMATLRSDGSPRVSGTEVDFLLGEAWIGSMPGAKKALDLLRDPRVAIHSAPLDTDLRVPDVKVAGRAVAVTDPEEFTRYLTARAGEGGQHPEGDFHLFRLDITEVACTSIGDPADHLVIESWRAGRGERRVERR
jgi:hypothetical protein